VTQETVLNSFFNRFTVHDLIIMSLTAGLGIVFKPFTAVLVHFITATLLIPGGVLAGGFYMMWIVIGAVLVGKNGSATLIALLQGIIVMALGVYGSHGFMSLLTYMLPGIAADFIFFISGKQRGSAGACFTAGISANVSGSLLVNLAFFRLPLVPLLLSLSVAALSGGTGGITAYYIIKRFMPVPSSPEKNGKELMDGTKLQ